MSEVKVTLVVTAPELTSAINNLATAISSSKVFQAQPSAPMPVQVAAPAPTPVPAPILSEPTQPVQPSATPIANVPLANAPHYTVDQIMAAGATLMDAGKVNELLNLLHSFGVQAVMDLKPEQLGAFATEMRKLGAAI